MAFCCAAALNIAGADRNTNGLSIPCGATPTLYHRVKAILPQAIVFFPLPHNEAQVFALIDDSLASRVLLSGGMILRSPGGLSLLADTGGRRMDRRLRRKVRTDHDRRKKRSSN